MSNSDNPILPDWEVSQWFNTDGPIHVTDLRGRVALVHTFQMLCPGCVLKALPQIRRVHEQYASDELAIIGLHTVFEHHDAMRPEALQVFMHEFGIRYPVGVDAPSEDGQPVPRTMTRLGLRGTPSLLLLDRGGRLRLRHFGHIEDLQLGMALGRLLGEPDTSSANDS